MKRILHPGCDDGSVLLGTVFLLMAVLLCLVFLARVISKEYQMEALRCQEVVHETD